MIETSNEAHRKQNFHGAADYPPAVLEINRRLHFPKAQCFTLIYTEIFRRNNLSLEECPRRVKSLARFMNRNSVETVFFSMNQLCFFHSEARFTARHQPFPTVWISLLLFLFSRLIEPEPAESNTNMQVGLSRFGPRERPAENHSFFQLLLFTLVRAEFFLHRNGNLYWRENCTHMDWQTDTHTSTFGSACW